MTVGSLRADLPPDAVTIDVPRRTSLSFISDIEGNVTLIGDFDERDIAYLKYSLLKVETQTAIIRGGKSETGEITARTVRIQGFDKITNCFIIDILKNSS